MVRVHYILNIVYDHIEDKTNEIQGKNKLELTTLQSVDRG